MSALAPRPPLLPRWLTALLVSGPLLVAYAPAFAQEKPPGPEDPYSDPEPPKSDIYDEVSKVLAAKTYKEGVRLAMKGQWQEAYVMFLAAWRDVKHWQTASSLGRVELEVGKYRDAVQHLSYARAAADLPEADRPEIERLIAKATAAMGTLEIRVTCNLAAAVMLDGEELGTTPYTGRINADPGQHRIEVKLGDRHEETEIDLHTGETAEVTLNLRVPPPPRPPAPPKPPVPPAGSIPRLSFAIGLSVLAAAGAVTGGALFTSNNEAERLGAIGAFGTSGALAVGAGVLWYLVLSRPPPPSPAARVVVLPLAGPEHTGILLRGAF